MTPKEIVERVRARNESDRVRCGGMELPSSSFQRCSDIDHLLAIHAAAVEYLSARRAWEAARPLPVLSEIDRFELAQANLAALCGWKAEEELG